MVFRTNPMEKEIVLKMLRQSAYGKRKPSIRLVGCLKCHNLFDDNLLRCSHCGYDRTYFKSGLKLINKEGWT